jgi:DNA-binding NarL/FixJ family response regulator
MPTRQNQLNRILADIDRQIASAEVELLGTMDDGELRRLIEKSAGLQLLRQRVESQLKDGEHVIAGVKELSERELAVFRLIGGGITSAQIAERLQISVSTVETYRERIKDKLQLATGTELNRAAILWAQRRSNGGTDPQNSFPTT